MTPEGQTKLKDFEGLRLKPYVDTVGKLTIGWGRNLSDRGISYDEARLLFDDDVSIATAEARANFDWFDTLSPVRQDFIVCMVFNLGVPRLRFFRRMLDAIERQDWVSAGVELLDSAWSRQVGPHRSEAMRKAIVDGVWD